MTHSAGLLLYRRLETTRSRRSQCTPEIEVFLGHFGGPYWQNKDEGAWTIPKGVIEDDEDPFDAAWREFEEETGLTPPSDPDALKSDTFEIEWPPNSGTTQQFPELDRADYFSLDEAAEKIVKGQRPLLDRLREAVSD